MCHGCAASFPAWRGIPDLRTRDDEFLDNRADRDHAMRLLVEFERCDFRTLLELYFDLSPEIPDDLRRRQIHHIRTAPGRVGHWLDAVGGPTCGPLLDLGCGTGTFLAAVGRDVPDVCGVDIALRWLVVARKRLDEEGLGHVPLVCACAEDLPLDGASLDAVVAGDVIEHVGDQAATLAEAHRVLRPGGRLFLASPNRYSLAAEPHVGVWGVGFLPRRWMAAYVRRVRGIEYRAVRNLGFRAWRRLLAASPFRGGSISVPALPESDLAHFGRFKRFAARCYNAVVTRAPGRQLGLVVGPLFHVVCSRPEPVAPSRPSPATRRRSRRSPARG